MPASQLQRALYYAEKLGWAVLPVFEIKNGCCACSAGEHCERPGKHPRTPHGVHDATTDPEQIRAWWRKWPDANIGVATGRISGIIVIDADPRKESNKTLKILVKELGPLPWSVKAHSGGGGTHRVYEYPDFKVTSDSNGMLLGPGLDVLSDGSYFVASRSTHISGNTYTWFEGQSPIDLKPATLPEAWLNRLRPPTEPKVRRVRGAVATEGESATDIAEGERNVRLTSLAGKLWRGGITHESLVAALLAENEKPCKPPLDPSEVKKIANSISKYPRPKVIDQNADLAEQVLQLALKEHFEGGAHLMYYRDGQFWRFDGRKWGPFRDELFDKRVLRTLNNIPHKQSTTAVIGQVRHLARAHLATEEDLLRFEGEPAPVINCKNGENYAPTMQNRICGTVSMWTTILPQNATFTIRRF